MGRSGRKGRNKKKGWKWLKNWFFSQAIFNIFLSFPIALFNIQTKPLKVGNKSLTQQRNCPKLRKILSIFIISTTSKKQNSNLNLMKITKTSKKDEKIDLESLAQSSISLTSWSTRAWRLVISMFNSVLSAIEKIVE